MTDREIVEAITPPGYEFSRVFDNTAFYPAQGKAVNSLEFRKIPVYRMEAELVQRKQLIGDWVWTGLEWVLVDESNIRSYPGTWLCAKRVEVME